MIGELYDGEFDNFPREDGIIKDEELSQEEVDKYLKAASGETDAVNRMDIQKLYDEYVNEIHKIENELSNIKKNLQLINKILEKQSNDEIINWDDVLPICRDCIYFFHKKDDVRFCVHFDSCCRAHRLLTEKEIVIPDNATNGDVLMLLFPSEEFEDKGYICQYPLDGMIHDFNSKWWNSPYKGDNENDK